MKSKGTGALAAKRVSDSQVTLAVQMLPSDANPWGHVHGGTIMKLVDTAAAVVAHRHARSYVVTARVDEMSFLAPVHVGDLVFLKASANCVGRTSMEVGVRVEAENVMTGDVTHVSTAYLVLVAVDANGRPREVPPLIAETEEEKLRMAAAQDRRQRRERVRKQL